jgi:hypothetical protein
MTLYDLEAACPPNERKKRQLRTCIGLALDAAVSAWLAYLLASSALAGKAFGPLWWFLLIMGGLVLGLAGFGFAMGAPQARYLRTGPDGFTLEGDDGSVRRRFSWRDRPVQLQLSHQVDWQNDPTTRDGVTSHSIKGLVPVMTYIPPAAFEEILTAARENGLKSKIKSLPRGWALTKVSAL